MSAPAALRHPVLPPTLRRPLGAVSIACGLLAVALGVLYAGSATAGPLDTWASDTVKGHFPHGRPVAQLVDSGGEPIGVVVLAAALALTCIVAGRRRLAALAIASQGVLGAATSLVKPVLDRTIHGGFLSYPSGHTAGATGFAIVATLLLVGLLQVGRQVGLAIVLGGATVAGAVAAWAQTLLGAHYWTDTVGGLLMAVALIPPTAMVIDRIADRLFAVGGPSGR